MIDPASMNDPVNAKEMSVTPEEIAELALLAGEYAADMRTLALFANAPIGAERLHAVADTLERQAQVIAELDTLLDSALS